MGLLRNKKSFTLAEIMVTVAIIAGLAALTIPSLLQAKRSANEVYARATLKTIATACENYSINNNAGYPGNMNQLISPVAPETPYLNKDYIGVSQGYNFIWPTEGDTTTYTFTATPVSASTGSRSFSVCAGAVLNEASGAVAPACP